MDKVRIVVDNYYETDCRDLLYNDILKEAYNRGSHMLEKYYG